MDEDLTLASWVRSRMDELNLNHRDLAERARVSLRGINEVLSGKTEMWLRNGGVNRKKIQGITLSSTRILASLGADTQKWAKKLGMRDVSNEILKSHATSKSNLFISQLGGILNEPLRSDDIEVLGKVQAEIGEALTIEVALRILINRH